MKKGLTEIVCILDRSGSMSHLTTDTIGGFNTFLKEQKEVEGEARLSLVLFDDEYDLLFDHVDIQSVEELTDKTYFARGNTALFDAIGRTINAVGERLKKTEEDERPEKVIFVITTDGHENASTEFTEKSQIKDMIDHQEEKYSWEFIYMGANQDAIAEGSTFGIKAGRAMNFIADSEGVGSSYQVMRSCVTNYRNNGNATIDTTGLEGVNTDSGTGASSGK